MSGLGLDLRHVHFQYTGSGSRSRHSFPNVGRGQAFLYPTFPITHLRMHAHLPTHVLSHACTYYTCTTSSCYIRKASLSFFSTKPHPCCPFFSSRSSFIGRLPPMNLCNFGSSACLTSVLNSNCTRHDTGFGETKRKRTHFLLSITQDSGQVEVVLVCKPVPGHEGRGRIKKQADLSSVVGGTFYKQGNLTSSTCLGFHKSCRSPHQLAF